MSDETGVTGEVARSSLGDQLRDLIPAGYEDDGYFGVTAVEIREFADEADRLRADVVRLDNLLIAERGVTARLRREVRGLRDERDTLQERIDAVINLADQWEVAQRENREALERHLLAAACTPGPQDFRYAATGCLEVPAVDPPLYRRGTFEKRLGELMGLRRPQDDAQAPQDGAEKGSEGDRASGGENGAVRAPSDTLGHANEILARFGLVGITEGRCLTCPGGYGLHKVGGKYPDLPHEVVVESKGKSA